MRLGGHGDELLRCLAQGPVVRIVVSRLQGSGPRDVGAWMALHDCGLIGTIGGGKLEFDAIADARALLAGNEVEAERRFALGPSLGQCCGGVVWLRYEMLQPVDVERVRVELLAAQQGHMPVALFGGGHVGLAIAAVLGALPVRTHWIDSREEVFPGERPQGRLAASAPPRGNEQSGKATFAHDLPLNVRCEHSEPVHGAVPTLEAGSHVLIMSFSHAEDLDILAACLKRRRERDDLPFVGLIGSKSKWATFRHRLEARGFSQAELDAVTSPIGVPGVVGKEPEVIAVAVAAQLMQQRR